MRVSWTEDDLAAEWLLQPAELNLLHGRRDVTRLGFAMQLKFFQMEGRFPTGPNEFADLAIQFVAKQLELPIDIWADYPWTGRNIKYQRAEIRKWLGFKGINTHRP